MKSVATFFSKVLFLVLLLVTPNSILAQSWDWAISGGGDLSDKATSIAMDDAGNTYITGYYNDSAYFGMELLQVDPFLTFGHNKEIFIAKIAPNGNYLWVKSGHNGADDRGLGICLDPSGNVYVTGTCWDGIQFDNQVVFSALGYTDNVFVVKLNNSGVTQWIQLAGTDTGDDHGYDLVSDNAGNIYVTGMISNFTWTPNGPGEANFGTNTTFSPDDSLAFVAKINPNGIWNWVRTFDGEDRYRDNRIAIDASDNVYVTGGFHGTGTFGSVNLTSAGGSDIFVVKYDQNGTFVFAERAGSELDDRGNDIVIGKDDKIYITGEFRSKCGFANDSINNYGSPTGKDIFVAKMDLNGNWLWAKKAGSNHGSEEGCGITYNKQHNIFICGQFRGNAHFGGNIELDAQNDSIQAFVAAIDTSGHWRWAMQAGGSLIDRAGAIDCDTNCHLGICGFFTQSATFEAIQLNGQLKKDAFAARISNACFAYDQPEPETPDYACEWSNSNVFTPNNDGLNDDYAFVDENCAVKSVQISIINRWGQSVYESSDPTKKWNGRDSNGNELVEGVYFYKALVDYGNIKESKQGFITLMK